LILEILDKEAFTGAFRAGDFLDGLNLLLVWCCLTRVVELEDILVAWLRLLIGEV
jgi:hypothetical protein